MPNPTSQYSPSTASAVIVPLDQYLTFLCRASKRGCSTWGLDLAILRDWLRTSGHPLSTSLYDHPAFIALAAGRYRTVCSTATLVQPTYCTTAVSEQQLARASVAVAVASRSPSDSLSTTIRVTRAERTAALTPSIDMLDGALGRAYQSLDDSVAKWQPSSSNAARVLTPSVASTLWPGVSVAKPTRAPPLPPMHFHKTRFADWARRYKHAAVKLGHSTADDAGLADHGDQALEGEVVSNTPFIQTVQAVCCFVVHGSHIILVSRGRNLVPFTDRRATITRGALASARAEWTASLLPTYGQRWMRSPGAPTMPTQPSDLKAHYVRE